MLTKILSHWNLSAADIRQVYSTTWDVAGSYILKRYDNLETLEQNRIIMTVLRSQNVPAARIVPTVTGDYYVTVIEADSGSETFYLLTEKLPGTNLTDIRTDGIAYRMGSIIGDLHLAFRQCENQLQLRDNSLLDELTGWIHDTLEQDKWTLVSEDDYLYVVDHLRPLYDSLPRQLIHRDVHFGNFLFDRGTFSGYIDFDLSQRNIRIFDLCYFALGQLTEEENNELSPDEWKQLVSETIRGYESRIPLTPEEHQAIPYVMMGIELLFAAWFVGQKDTAGAENAMRIYQSVYSNICCSIDHSYCTFNKNGQ